MPLDLQAQAIVDRMALWPTPNFSSLTAEAYRKYLAYIPPFPTPTDKLLSVTDSSLPSIDGPIKTRIYRPSLAGELPLTVFFHGGGFISLGLDTHDNICRVLAARSQSVVVAVDYRLAPEYRFPAAVNDALASVRWLHGNAESLGLDPHRIAVAGDSAGGNLAAVVAQELNTILCHQLLLYPVTDQSGRHSSREEFANGAMLTESMLEWFKEQYLPDSQVASEPRVSPLMNKSLKNLPRATIITAECDPLRDEGEAYAHALSRTGTTVTLKRWNGQFHGFMSLLGSLDAANAALNFAANSLKNVFEIPLICPEFSSKEMP